LGSRAIGGAGLIIQEATAVSPEGRISPEDLGIWKEEHLSKLKQITTFIKQRGSIAGIQLAHAGRKASSASPWNGSRQIAVADGGWQTVAPSALPFHPSEQAPEALSEAGIQQVIDDFRSAALRSVAAGYEVVELHGAHGYLIHQFLSPLSNQRTDAYGGSFDNRIRLLLEIVTAVQTVWPAELPLFVRISATDYADGGWTLEDSVKLSSILQQKGVDLIDCSSGGIIPGVKIPVGPDYQVPFAERIKKESGILTGAVGLITNPQQAEAIVAKGQADMVLIARESLRNPNFPLFAAHELDANIQWPVQYERAKW
jgi:2,4-dienoyl-CoA reductase-like NADH-dependent reductase (Old Yellow Enzyme family)